MTTDRLEQLRGNLERVRSRIRDAERAAGRAEGSVELLPVTKFHAAEDIALLAELGVHDVAENREQEAKAKAEQLPEMRFHMIGQIQSKKANSVARWAGTVHSVDSLKLVNGLNRGVGLAVERGDRDASRSVMPVFLQVSADGDEARGGIVDKDLPVLVDAVEEAANLTLVGLMVVPPLEADPTAVFERVRHLTDQQGQRIGRQLKLSAGMSADLEKAIAAGSDIVRVGTDVMGERPVG